ncbi:MAG: hypothetical protein ACFFDF_22430 [Candidatus Odinarchaeota archaeon]
MYGYLRRNINETETLLYFDAHSETDLEIDLQNTYYMIYILKMLNLFDLNTQKIKQFVVQNIDYANIVNIYYSYKISEILRLQIDFNIDLTINLVKNVFSDTNFEFYKSTDCEIINQEIFLWICEMARNSEINIECSYEDALYLGTVNTITTAFNNLIYEEYGEFTSVRFESEQLGILNLEKQFNDTYQVNFLVPEDPKYFPNVDGTVRIYDHSKIIGEIPIYIQTCLEQVVDYEITEINDNVIFEVNISRRLGSEFQAIYNSIVRGHVFENGANINSFNFTKKDFSSYSKYTYTYNRNDDGDYYFNIALVDSFFPNGLTLFEYEIQSNPSTPSDPTPPPPPPVDSIYVNGIFLAIIAAFITTFASILVIWAGRKIKLRIRNSEFIEEPEKTNNKIRDTSPTERNKQKKIDFSDWD